MEEDLRNELAKVIPFRFELLYVVQRPNHYMSKFSANLNTCRNWKWLNRKISIAASGDLAKVGLINGIANTGYVMPGLSQDDSDIPYCNADHLPNHCDSTYSICHCSHLVKLKLCEVYEFLLTDGACMQFFLSTKLKNFQCSIFLIGIV